MNYIILLISFFLCTIPVFAAPVGSYTAYMTSTDAYRASQTEFTTARSEYKSFKTLTSEQKALDTAKQMMIKRNLMLTAYLTFLTDTIDQTSTFSPAAKAAHKGAITNELTFYNFNSGKTQAVHSIDDAITTNKDYEKRIADSLTVMGKAGLMITVGRLAVAGARYSDALLEVTAAVNAKRPTLSSSSVNNYEQWLLKIKNKQTVYDSTIAAATTAIDALDAGSENELTRKVSQIQGQLANAKQYLSDGMTYMNELTNALAQ